MLSDVHGKNFACFFFLGRDHVNANAILSSDRKYVLPFRSPAPERQPHFKQAGSLDKRKVGREKPSRLGRFNANLRPSLRDRFSVSRCDQQGKASRVIKWPEMLRGRRSFEIDIYFLRPRNGAENQNRDEKYDSEKIL